MRSKILMLVIGILVGAILATGGYYFYEKSLSDDVTTENMQEPENNGENGEMQKPDGDGNFTMDENGTVPDKPDGEMDGNGVDPSAMQEGSNQTTQETATNES